MWVNDLIYYDGPLLSQLKHKNNEYYLKLWCDCDDVSNRWMYFKIYEKDRLRLLVGEKSLIDCLKDQPDRFVFFSDESESDSVNYIVDNGSIPFDYLPEEDSYLSLHDSLLIEDTTAFIFENDWSMDSLRDLFKKFSQIFDFNYLVSNRSTINSSFPWKDGASTVHFYERIKNAIPQRDRCKLDAVSYASPGYMKISGEQEKSHEALGKIKDYLDQQVDIQLHYSKLYKSILAGKYNSMPFEGAVREFDSCNSCNESLNELANLILGVDKDWFMQQFEYNFVKAKILMGHTRRLESFANYLLDSNVRAVSALFFEEQL
ncbi:hypothetical protein [Alteromonas sp. OM2203]|uniref:hypothetical protein n=1 Tax=Alteromonas sp. OM2203 TaxID=3398817 RepID=UPI003AF3850F